MIDIARMFKDGNLKLGKTLESIFWSQILLSKIFPHNILLFSNKTWREILRGKTLGWVGVYIFRHPFCIRKISNLKR